MPASKTPDQLKEKTAKLKKKLAEKGEKLDAAQTRALAKKIRRVQRRRRVLVARATKLAGKQAAKKKEA